MHMNRTDMSQVYRVLVLSVEQLFAGHAEHYFQYFHGDRNPEYACSTGQLPKVLHKKLTEIFGRSSHGS